MILHITMPFDTSIETDLSVRHTLVDTIEERNIGEVIEEGTGENGMYVVVLIKANGGDKQLEMINLLKSLGLDNAVLTRNKD